jgi:hypothetical protein
MNEIIEDFDVVYDTRIENDFLGKIYSKLYRLLEKYNSLENLFLNTFQNINHLYYIFKDQDDVDTITKYILIRGYNISSLSELKKYYRKIDNNYKVFHTYIEYLLKTFNKHTRLSYILKTISLGYTSKEVYNNFSYFTIEIRNYIEEEKSLLKLMTNEEYINVQNFAGDFDENIDISTNYKELKFEIKNLIKILALNYHLYNNYYNMIQSLKI